MLWSNHTCQLQFLLLVKVTWLTMKWLIAYVLFHEAQSSCFCLWSTFKFSDLNTFSFYANIHNNSSRSKLLRCALHEQENVFPLYQVVHATKIQSRFALSECFHVRVWIPPPTATKKGALKTFNTGLQPTIIYHCHANCYFYWLFSWLID